MFSCFFNILLFVTIVLVDAFSTSNEMYVCRKMRRQTRTTRIYASDVMVETEETSNTTSDGSNRDKAAIIFLHGLGDTPDGWSKLLPEALPNYRPKLSDVDITYVFPPAQNVGITVNGGEQMPGWFDVFDWPIGVDAKDDPKGLAMSVKRVEKIVNQLKDEEGIDPSRIILGGFSQGGAVALMAAYNRRKQDAPPFAACVCMSGYLPMKDYLDVSEEAAKKTKLFWAHGEYDEKILYEQQIFGVEKLEGSGVDVTACSYPVGHESSNFEEIDDMAAFLEDILCSEGPINQDVSKSAQVDSHKSTLQYDDEKNVLLYYLVATGIDDIVEKKVQIPV